MNLGKLLGAGKSFFSGCTQAAYRQNKHVYLPKFNEQKNPFIPKPDASAPADKKTSSTGARATRATNWTSRLNPFRPPAPTANAPIAIQPELSLEAVKVVQNDLTEADIEVVPVKSRTIATPEPTVLPAGRGQWEFSNERLVKSA